MAESRSQKVSNQWYTHLFTFLWYDVILLLYIGLIAVFKEMSTKPPVLNVNQIEKRTGHVAVLTGGPRGLAIGIIKRLHQLDYTIIMGVRNVEDGKRRYDELRKSNPDFNPKKVKFFRMDLNSLKSIRQFANDVLVEVPRIDLLLCNAAIMAAPDEVTEDGYESQFQVNYLSNFLLTELLLDKMKQTAKAKSDPCQIIYTSSVVYSYGRLDFNELEKCNSVYTPYKFYFSSKLYPIMAMQKLERQLEQQNANVHCYAVHPGLIPTDLWTSAAGNLRFVVTFVNKALSRMFRNLENGADTILCPAFSPEYQAKGGLYLESGASIPLCKTSLNTDLQNKLYARSLELASLKRK